MLSGCSKAPVQVERFITIAASEEASEVLRGGLVRVMRAEGAVGRGALVEQHVRGAAQHFLEGHFVD